MPDEPQEQYAGQTQAEREVWFAYFTAARDSIADAAPYWAHPKYSRDVDDKAMHAKREIVAAIQGITGAGFALEFRMRRVLKVLKATPAQQRQKFNVVLSKFWAWAAALPRWDKQGQCAKPPEWDCPLVVALDTLRVHRNSIGHGNADEVRQLLGSDPLQVAACHFNNAVLAIRLINFGTGYTNDRSVAEEYWTKLMLKPSWQ